jgi:hypothetical protein
MTDFSKDEAATLRPFSFSAHLQQVQRCHLFGSVARFFHAF